VNLYNGCDHNCVYCYNRPGLMRGGDSPEDRLGKFDAELARTATTAGASLLRRDPYCHAEVEESMTRTAIALMMGHDVPIAS